MPAESVKARLSKLSNGADAQEIRLVVAAVVDALQAVAAKLDADAGVTDTNYAATVANLVKD